MYGNCCEEKHRVNCRSMACKNDNQCHCQPYFKTKLTRDITRIISYLGDIFIDVLTTVLLYNLGHHFWGWVLAFILGPMAFTGLISYYRVKWSYVTNQSIKG